MGVTKHTRTTGERVKDATIEAVDIAADAVNGTKIADDSIGSEHLEADALGGSTQIKDGAVGSAKLGADSVYGDKIADDGIGSSILIADDVIHVEHILNAQVAEAKLTEHLEHGTLVNISKGGRWKEFGTAFGAAPHVVVSGEEEIVGTYVTLGATPVVGSFKVELAADGTLNGNYIAWGPRA